MQKEEKKSKKGIKNSEGRVILSYISVNGKEYEITTEDVKKTLHDYYKKKGMTYKILKEKIAEEDQSGFERVENILVKRKTYFDKKIIDAIIKVTGIEFSELCKPKGDKTDYSKQIGELGLLLYLQAMCPSDERTCKGYIDIVNFTKGRKCLSEWMKEELNKERK